MPFFRAATPELELGALNVGSRPAKRNPTGGVESLRAIPWIFAWEQTRLSLPAWLGITAGWRPCPSVLRKRPTLAFRRRENQPARPSSGLPQASARPS